MPLNLCLCGLKHSDLDSISVVLKLSENMAYLSDIDLATLHKKRLEEKNNYKLSSWYNRRFYDEETCREHSSIMAEKHRVKSKVTLVDKASTKPKAKTSPINKQASAKSVDVDGERFAIDHNSNVYDEGYFSSSTLNRRRSGTWP